MNKIQKARLNKWADALESGNYKQGRWWLRPNLVEGDENGPDTFCCLGVACDLYAKNTKKGKWDGEKFRTNKYDENDANPPEPVTEYFGISIETAEKLVDMNDEKHNTFKTIAKFIRKLASK